MNCRDKCRDCRFSCSGSQSRTKGIGRPSFGSGSSSGSDSRPSGSRPSGSRPSGGGIRELTSQKRNTFVGSRNCDYTCERNGGCKVTYVGPPRAGRTQGSCFPRDFGGSCSGTPRECQDCNQAINCWYSQSGALQCQFSQDLVIFHQYSRHVNSVTQYHYSSSRVISYLKPMGYIIDDIFMSHLCEVATPHIKALQTSHAIIQESDGWSDAIFLEQRMFLLY